MNQQNHPNFHPRYSPLQGETPSNNRHILREPHRQEHLRAEDPRVANFYPLLQTCGDRGEARACTWVILHTKTGSWGRSLAKRVTQAKCEVPQTSLCTQFLIPDLDGS